MEMMGLIGWGGIKMSILIEKKKYYGEIWDIYIDLLYLKISINKFKENFLKLELFQYFCVR